MQSKAAKTRGLSRCDAKSRSWACTQVYKEQFLAMVFGIDCEMELAAIEVKEILNQFYRNSEAQDAFLNYPDKGETMFMSTSKVIKDPAVDCYTIVGEKLREKQMEAYNAGIKLTRLDLFNAVWDELSDGLRDSLVSAYLHAISQLIRGYGAFGEQDETIQQH